MIMLVVSGIIAAVIFIQRFIYIKFAFKNLNFSYDFSQTEVNEGDIFYITEVIENKKILPLPAVSMVLEPGAGIAFADGEEKTIENKSVFCFYTVGIYKKITRVWRVKALMRGRFNINNITVNVRDAFGLVKIAKDFSCNTDVLILPVAYDTNDRMNSLHLTGGNNAVLTGYYSNPFEIQKILPYTYGEPFNRINWKASAKSQDLMVNVEQPSVSEKILVILDTSEKYFVEKNIKICATLPKILPEDSEITFVSNGSLPENYYNPLIKFNSRQSFDCGYIQTQEFDLRTYERNFKRMLAETLTSDSQNNQSNQNKLCPINKLADDAVKNIFCHAVIIVKGGKIYDYETAQTIFL